MSLRSGADKKAPNAPQPSLLHLNVSKHRPVNYAEMKIGQEKQAKLLASDTGHFSMIRFDLFDLPTFLYAQIFSLILVLFRALHLADLITEMNGKSPFLPLSEIHMLLLLTQLPQHRR